MTYSPSPEERAGIRRDIEESHGAEPMDKLLAEYDAIVEDWAEGGALFGAGGFANDIRKKVLSLVMLRIRDELIAKGEKPPTEKVLDALAHADKQYTEWLDRHVIKRAEWLKLDVEKSQIEMRANRGQSMLKIGARIMG
jgi:hypothetical protein